MTDEPVHNSPPESALDSAGDRCVPCRRFRLNPRLLGKGWKRRYRWLFRVVLGGPLLLIVLALLLIRSPLVGYLARGAIEPLLGCEMRAGSVGISLDGRLIMDDLSLRVPGLDSTAGEFLFVRRAEADLDWSGFLRGEVNPTGLRLHEPVFRVSQSTVTGQVSVANLQPVAQKKQRLTQPPRIDVLDGMLEFGEHTPGAKESYRALMQLNVSGNLEPSDPRRPIYLVRFQERIKVPRAGPVLAPSADLAANSAAAGGGEIPEQFGVGLVVNGKIDLDHSSAKVRVVNIGVNPWPEGSVPTYLRDVWSRLNIQGEISEALLTYDPVKGPEATITVDHATMEALVPAAAHSGKTDDMLSLRSVVGTINVSTDHLKAELDATVEGQTAPAHVSLDYAGLTDDAPFKCVITTKAFRLDKDPGWLAFTPVDVKENLAAFCGPTGLITGEVVIERGAPTLRAGRNGIDAPGVAPTEPAPLKVTGRLDLSEGTAAFHRVPYPFKNMTGHFEFDQDKITLTTVDGRADSGATIHATGWIGPPDESAEISLHIVVNNIPLDQVFADSLPASRKGAMTALFNPDQYAALRASGLVSDANSKKAAAEALPELESQWERLLNAPSGHDSAPESSKAAQSLDAIGARIADARRVANAPDFDLGGVADLDITVHSPRGKESEWNYTVMTTIPKAGFVLKGFPLPVVGNDIVLRITERAATLLEGTFAGAAGGQFVIDANVVLDEGGKPVVSPDVRMHVTDVPINDLLLFAAQHAGAAGDSPVTIKAAAPAAGSADTKATPLQDVLRNLDVNGVLSCDLAIWPVHGETLDAKAEISFSGVQLGPIVLGDGSRLRASNVEGLVWVDSDRVSVPIIRGDLRVHELAGSIERPFVRTTDAGSFRLIADSRLTTSLGVMVSPTDVDQSVVLPGSKGGPDAVPPPTPPASFIKHANATLFLNDVDASLDIAPILRLVSDRTAASVSTLTSKYRPSGRFDAQLIASLDEARRGDLDGRIISARGLALDYEGERLQIDFTRGSIGLHAAFDTNPARPTPAHSTPTSPSVAADAIVAQGRSTPPLMLAFDDVELTMRSDTSAPMKAYLDGLIALDMNAAADTDTSGSASSSEHAPSSDAVTPSSLAARVENLRFESCLVRSLLASQLDAETAARVDSLDPRGGFDATLAIASPSTASGPAAELDISGIIQPRSLSLVVNAAPFEIPVILGDVSFDSHTVSTHGLGLRGDSWSLALQAERVKRDPPLGSTPRDPSLRLAVIAHAATLTPQLRALLPESVRTKLDESNITLAGAVSLAPLVYTSEPRSGAGSDERLAGSLAFAGLAMSASLDIRDGSGQCDFTLLRPAGRDAWSFDARLRSPRLTLADLDVHSVEAHVLTGSSPDVILIPSISAECYSGRITGSGSLEPAPATRRENGEIEANEGRAYRGEVSLAGVRFAPILDAIGGAAPQAPVKKPTPASTGSRGVVDAAVTFSGVLGKPETLTGLGRARISGGDVVRMPVVMTLMQLSNFQLPARDSFDYMQTTFQLSGSIVNFEQVALISRTLAITGYGAMTWPAKELDLRFNSRSAGRVPLLSDVVETLRNEVMTTRVTGTLMNPSIDPEALLGTRQLIGNALGQPTGPRRSISEQEADRAARAERDRLKGASSGVPTDTDRQ